MPLAYAIGTLIGPYLGANLADPYNVLDKEGNYLPGLEHDARFFARYPFALPCFVTSLFNLAAIIFGFFFLEETLGTEPPDPGQAKAPAQAEFTETHSTVGVKQAKSYGTLTQSTVRPSVPPDARAGDVPSSLASEAEVQQRWRRGISPASRSPSDRQRKLSSERRLSSVYQDGDQDEGSALTVAALSRADQMPQLGRRRSSAWDLVVGTNREAGPDDRALAPGLHVHSPAHYFHQHRPSSHPSHSRPSLSEPGTAHRDEVAQQEPVRLPAPSLRTLMTVDIFNVISSQVRPHTRFTLGVLPCPKAQSTTHRIAPSPDLRLTLTDAAEPAQYLVHGSAAAVLLHACATWWHRVQPLRHWKHSRRNGRAEHCGTAGPSAEPHAILPRGAWAD